MHLTKIFFTLLLLSHQLSAQQLFTVYDTTNTPLVVNQINCITQEGNTLWAGTDYGISSFNGSNWDFFLFNNQPQSFLNNILSIAVDASGNKWLGTGGGGLGKFDGANWTVYNTSNTQLPSNIVTTIAFDSQNRMWLGTTAGVAVWDLDTSWIIYQQFSSALMSDHIYKIERGENDTMWIGTQNGGLTRAVDTSLITYTIQNGGVPDNTILDVALDTFGHRWLGCAAHGLGSFQYDSPPFVEFSPANSDMTSFTVNAIAIDSGNKILCATATGGLCKYLGSIYWQIFDAQTVGLPDSALNDVLIDNNGTIWLASENVGIIRFDEMLLHTDELNSKNNSKKNIQLFPNPSSDFIQFSFSSFENQMLKVELFDMTGRMLREDFISTASSFGKIKMNISGLNNGTYLLKLISGENISSGLFVKVSE